MATITLLVDDRPENFNKEEFELAKMAVEEVEAIDNFHKTSQAAQLLKEMGVPSFRSYLLAVVARTELRKQTRPL